MAEAESERRREAAYEEGMTWLRQEFGEDDVDLDADDDNGDDILDEAGDATLDDEDGNDEMNIDIEGED
ncbi:Protein of unknown function [Pyronema omphalodes CBS 100304]|uniref:Uncharacterized protein n=1 Tax=Pyronema omphalodes (strain CBS 100304) TaxID=1076935 RepID=U4LU41_PYROM|nr:Protein of unknown function [Pyronema omphalodes CBS 100304]